MVKSILSDRVIVYTCTMYIYLLVCLEQKFNRTPSKLHSMAQKRYGGWDVRRLFGRR